MSEMALDPDLQERLRRATPEQQSQILNLLNANQQAIALPYQFPGRPENFGQALKNIGSNIGYRAAVKYGLQPDPQGILANQKYLQSQYDMRLDMMEEVRKNELRKQAARIFPNIPVQELAAYSADALEELLTKRMGKPTTNAAGIVTQTSPLTNVQEILIEPSDDRQDFNLYMDNIKPPFKARYGTNYEDYMAGTLADRAKREKQAEEDVTLGNMFRTQYMQGIVNNVQTIQQGALGARSGMSDLYLLRDLIKDPRTDQGYFSKMRKVATSIFGDLGLATDRDISQEELMQAITQKMAIGMRNTSEGGGMPGSMSDSDRVFLTQMMPQLTNTPQGNALLVEMMIAMNKRKIALDRAVQNYFKENGTYEGFESVYDKFQSQDMFADIEEKADAMFTAADDDSNTFTVDGRVPE